MEKSVNKRLGIIESDFPKIKLPDTNIWTYLHPYHKKWSNLTAIVCSKTTKTYNYKELSEASLRWAKELEKYFHDGRPPTVAIILPNNIEYPVVFLGAAAVGAPVSPIRCDFKPGLALYILKETNPKVLVIDSSVFETFKSVIETLEGKLKVFVHSPTSKHYSGEDLFHVLSSKNEALDVEVAKKVDPESIAMITFSSGTTGKPKGVLISHKAVVNYMVCASLENICPLRSADGSKQDTLIAALPFAYLFGLQYYSIEAAIKGCRVVVCDYNAFAGGLTLLEKYKPQVLTIYPHHIEDFNKFDISSEFNSVRVIMTLGSPPNPASFIELNEKAGNKIFLQDHYGTSEVGGALYSPLKVKRLGITGKLGPHAKARFVDINTGEPILEPCKPGEIYLQTASMMKGYLNNRKATEEAINNDNWFQTGDLGYYDEDHFISVTGRVNDMITVNRKKISPLVIESVLKRHDAVRDVVVVGSPDFETGEEVPKAFVIRKTAVEEVDLIAFVAKHTPSEMWLRGGVTFVESFPRNHMGKILRLYLRDFSWSQSEN